MRGAALLCALCLLSAGPVSSDTASVCRGTTADGSLENGWRLPRGGDNFAAYSGLGILLGRTYVHSTVHGIVVDAFAALRQSLPEVRFVYGETGRKSGGQFKPHKTHRNGLSVDFMVPVRDAEGRSIPLPTRPWNKWGYSIEFDARGRVDDLAIDFEAIAEHIYQLHRAAQAHGAGIRVVIFAQDLQPHLRATSRWKSLEDQVRFSTRPAWVRHDDHYHVDFEVDCP